MMHKIFKKPISFLIIFSYSLIILASLSISGIVIYYILYQQLDRNLGQNLTGLSQTIADFIPGEWLPLLKRQDQDMVGKLALIQHQNNLRNIAVIDKNSMVIISLDSTVVKDTRFYLLESGIVDKSSLVAGRAMDSPLFKGNDGRLYKSAFAPIFIQSSKAVAGFIFIEANAQFLHIFRALRNVFFLIVIIAITGTLLVSIGISRTIIGPINTLLAAVRRIDDGDLTVRVNLKLHNEFRTLADYFNRMTENLEDKETRLKDKISSLEILSGGIAHEIRNPLTSMRLYIDLIQAKKQQGVTPDEYLDRIKNEIVTLDNLVNDFLIYSRTDMLRLKEEPLAPIIRAAWETVRTTQADKTIAFTEKLEESLVIYCDRPKLVRVFSNLLMNAAEFVPSRGGSIRVTASQEGGKVKVSIFDNGPGIPAKAIHKIFDPFYTSRADGTGLGLAIVQKVVAQHRGLVYARDLKNEPGIFNTCFTLYFPREKP